MALVDLDEVRAYIGKPDGDTEQDAQLQQLIDDTGVAFYKETGRKFEAEGSEVERTFDLLAWDVANRIIAIDDLSAAPSAVKTIDSAGADVTTYTVATDLVLYPLNRETWEPITAIKVRPAAAGLSTSYQVAVTGTWGFPAVPGDVRAAALKQIKTWWRRDIVNTGSGDLYAPEPQDLERPWGLANEVIRMLKVYRRPGVR